MREWSVVVTSGVDPYTPIGELNRVWDLTVGIGLNSIDSASFRIRIDDPMATTLLKQNCFVKVYRNGRLIFFGPVVSLEENADTAHTVSVNAAGAAWLLNRVYLGVSWYETNWQELDRGQILQFMLLPWFWEDVARITRFPPFTWDRDDPPTSGSRISYTHHMKTFMEILRELSQGLGGFDWYFAPREYEVITETFGEYPDPILRYEYGVISTLYTAPVIGEDRPNAVFEYGVGRSNVASYRRTWERETVANRVYHVAQDGERLSVLSAHNQESEDTWGMMQDQVQIDLPADDLNQIIDVNGELVSLRQAYLNEHVAVRSAPRQVIEFTPHIDPQRTGRLPQYGTEFGLGDWIYARAAIQNVVRFDGRFRVWGVRFALDNNGIERMTLTLTDNV